MDGTGARLHIVGTVESPNHEFVAAPRAPASGARLRAPVELAAGLLRGRYTSLILWNLFWGRKGFYQILREVGGLNRPLLAHELQELERFGLVQRVPPMRGGRVEYALSPLGDTLRPVLVALYEWGLFARTLPVAREIAGLEARRVPPGEHCRDPEVASREEADSGDARNQSAVD